MNSASLYLSTAAVGAVLLCPVRAAPVADDLKPAEKARMSVRLRLIDIEARRLLDSYDRNFSRQISLKESIARLQGNVANNRLGQYQQAIKEAQQSLEETKQKLEELEEERGRLLGRLGRKATPDTAEAGERVQRTLDRILERLTSLEERVGRLERRR
jgi:hypothetical protein